ncbi:MAG: hypothetical protein RR478_04990 [Bacilli bacterium]
MITLTNKDFLIATKTKDYIKLMDSMLINVSNKEIIYKDKIRYYSLDLLEAIYKANDCIDKKKLEGYLESILGNIVMIDFILELFLERSYFSQKNIMKLTNLLIEVKRMSTKWIENSLKEAKC